jgi:hypothetical protein
LQAGSRHRLEKRNPRRPEEDHGLQVGLRFNSLLEKPGCRVNDHDQKQQQSAPR